MSGSHRSPEDIMREPHFAVVRTSTIHHEADERSRTVPGHGYPAHTETVLSYEPFATREEWVSRIEALTRRNERFRAIEARPARVTTQVTVGTDAPR